MSDRIWNCPRCSTVLAKSTTSPDLLRCPDCDGSLLLTLSDVKSPEPLDDQSETPFDHQEDDSDSIECEGCGQRMRAGEYSDARLIVDACHGCGVAWVDLDLETDSAHSEGCHDSGSSNANRGKQQHVLRWLLIGLCVNLGVAFLLPQYWLVRGSLISISIWIGGIVCWAQRSPAIYEFLKPMLTLGFIGIALLLGQTCFVLISLPNPPSAPGGRIDARNWRPAVRAAARARQESANIRAAHESLSQRALVLAALLLAHGVLSGLVLSELQSKTIMREFGVWCDSCSAQGFQVDFRARKVLCKKCNAELSPQAPTQQP